LNYDYDCVITKPTLEGKAHWNNE